MAGRAARDLTARTPPRRRGLRAVAASAVWLAWVVSAGAGCCTVTLYEPMGTLQRPTLVQPTAPVFEGTRVMVRCLPGDDMPASDAERLCRNVATTFRLQGAECETQVPRGREEVFPVDAFEGRGADLTVEIVSRTEHSYDYPALAIISALTLTTIPSIDEQTFSQEVRVRGRNQSVLASETYRARFVNYTGYAVWGINWLVDWLFRDDDQDLSGEAPKKSFSADFYRQVSQLTFNARVRSDVLGQTQAPRRARPAVVAPAPADAPPPAPADAPQPPAPQPIAPQPPAPPATPNAPSPPAMVDPVDPAGG